MHNIGHTPTSNIYTYQPRNNSVYSMVTKDAFTSSYDNSIDNNVDDDNNP